jgi:ferrous iron transport protein A
LERLAKGERARVAAIETPHADLEVKLREVGFSEGDEVELLSRGPLGGQPLAVRLNRTIVALRASEAAAVRLEETT